MNSREKNYIPSFYFSSVLEIPYDFLICHGIKGLLFDLDNTLITSHSNCLSTSMKNFLNQLKLQFKIIIISNASLQRLSHILKNDFNYVYLNLWHKKPSLFGFRKALKLMNMNNSQVAMIGDQLKTDIIGANKMNIKSILVKPLDLKNESVFTRFNRYFFEKPFLKKMKARYFQIYKSKFEDFDHD